MSAIAAQGVGTVLASFGRGALVQAGAQTLKCGLVGRRLRPVCGDRVAWRLSPEAGGPAIESIAARHNLIERIDARGRAEPVAANIDRLGIVVAPQPAPDWFLVDRYWAGALLKDVATVLIVNKRDLGLAAVDQQLAAYRGLGLLCLDVGCLPPANIDRLRSALHGITLLVGQSGVGKSSLVNALAPHFAAQTAALTRDAEGRHTTTTARWYSLGAEAAIIDAPGVRDFAPPAQVARAAQRGFLEILAASARCRFNDCRHFEEPGCAVRDAVGAGRIHARRYESYRRLARLYEDLAPR